jgi:hypothetical protein
MDTNTLLAQLDFTRARLLGSLTTIEKSGQDPAKVLAWRPGPGRAHIAWQAMHCAATHDKYLHVRLLGGTERDKQLVERFGGGSTPSDENLPTLADIRAALERNLAPLRGYIASLKPADFDRVLDFPNNAKRSLGEALMLLIWHEAHHQGQIHLTWNLYKASHGL